MPGPTDRDLYQREIDLARDQANKGGPASAYCHFNTKGEGTFDFDKRIDFGCTFIEQPFPAFCSQVDLDDAEDLFPPVGDAPPALPLCSGYVTAWDTTANGHFVGCWVAVRVVYPVELPTAEQIDIRHYFTFQAVALKDLSDAEEDEAAPA